MPTDRGAAGMRRLSCGLAVLCASGCGGGAPPPQEAGAGGIYVQADASQLSEMLAGLEGPDERTRERAAGAIGLLGPEGAKAVPGLIAALKDRSPRVRRAAIDALGRIGPAAAESAPALESLARQGPSREVAAGALGRIRAPASAKGAGPR